MTYWTTQFPTSQSTVQIVCALLPISSCFSSCSSWVHNTLVSRIWLPTLQNALVFLFNKYYSGLCSKCHVNESLFDSTVICVPPFASTDFGHASLGHDTTAKPCYMLNHAISDPITVEHGMTIVMLPWYFMVL